MARCLISFGANLGQPANTIREAASRLQTALADGLLDFKLSRFFRTPAVGGPAGQPPFINAVAALQVEQLTAWDVWHAVRRIEQDLGRVRIERWEARRIDLDVLMFDAERIWTQHFKLPHPRMVMRRFILEPALDVAADWIEPVSGWSLGQLAQSLRRGAASIALVSRNRAMAQRVMELAATNSQARWLTPQLIAAVTAESSAGLSQSSSRTPVTLAESLAGSSEHQRWLGLVDQASLVSSTKACLQPSAKMVFVLAEPLTISGAAWEDVHRPLAAWMGLCGNLSAQSSSSSVPVPVTEPKQDDAQLASAAKHWPLEGPRYLLATDDLKWTEHEIIAALEAMDCPVEPLPALES